VAAGLDKFLRKENANKKALREIEGLFVFRK
jgi:hypothetical protein